jgi:uncharacterized protein YhaN
MKIEKLDIKGYGKLNNKVISLSSGFNIIHGQNESGKSTIQMFIKDMLYSQKGRKTKKFMGKQTQEKYRPWNGNAYKGSLAYRLDNGRAFLVERDFENNTVKVFDECYNDITNTFNQSRDSGPLFSLAHIGLNEECFTKTAFIGQMDLKIDTDGQKELMDRISNISETGFEDVSLKKATDALKQALIGYVGTEKSTTRPLDKVIQELEELDKRKLSLLEERDRLFNFEEQVSCLKAEKDELEKGKTVLNYTKEVLSLRGEIEELKRQKKELSETLNEIYTYEEKRGNLPEKTGNGHKARNSVNNAGIAGFGIVFAGALFWGLFKQNHLAVSILVALISGFATILLMFYKMNKSAKSIEYAKEKKTHIEEYLESLYRRVALVYSEANSADDIKDFVKETGSNIDKIYEKIEITTNNIRAIYKKGSLGDIGYDEFMDIILDTDVGEAWKFIYGYTDRLQNSMNILISRISRCESSLGSLDSIDGELQSVDRRIEELEVEKVLLEETGFCIQTAMDVLNESALEIKRDFTPILNSSLSGFINGITSSKYSEVRVDDSFIPKIEEPFYGSIVKVDDLSGGTVDQIYLALRLALVHIMENSTETIPVIMDEVFAHYDDTRTEEALKLINRISSQRQVVLFTCKERETESAIRICNGNINVIELM